MALSVSELAELAGTSADTVRYYGRLGLLPETGRTTGGHRYYDDLALERLRFIKGAQWLELRLDEIAELLEMSDQGRCPCAQAEGLIRQRIEAIDAETARLAQIRADLCCLLPEPSAPAAGEGADPMEVVERDVTAATDRVAGLTSHSATAPPHVGCGCCDGAATMTPERERAELKARLEAVERRLGGIRAGRGDGAASRARPSMNGREQDHEARNCR